MRTNLLSISLLCLAAALPGQDLRRGIVDADAVVVGRAVPRADGRWMGLAALGLPEPPPARVLARRLKLEMWRLLRHERRATWEDLLRRRSEVLYRTCATWCWLRTEDR